MELAGDATQVLAGIAKTGDHVDVVGTIKTPDGKQIFGTTVARGLLVLNAAPSPGGSTVGGTESYTAIVRATDAQAQRIFFIEKNGDWTLELRPALHSADSSLSASTVGSIVEAGR
jgi:hypothetical protein